jgi:hypothetical protein
MSHSTRTSAALQSLCLTGRTILRQARGGSGTVHAPRVSGTSADEGAQATSPLRCEIAVAVRHEHRRVLSGSLHRRAWLERSGVIALLVGTGIAQAGTQLPASPSTLQQAQPAFGATAERADSSAAPKKPEPLGFRSSTILGTQTEPTLSPTNDAAKGALSGKRSASKSAKNLFDMDDRTIIIVSGRPSTAGELKKALSTGIAKKAGVKRTVAAGPRKVDTSAFNVVAAAGVVKARGARSVAVATAPALLSTRSLNERPVSLKTSGSSFAVDPTNSFSSQKCLDRGPPAIAEIRGNLKAGGQVALWGRCFGERAGHVEIIGAPFPGGKLRPAFAAWDSAEIVIELPTLRGVADSPAVAVTVVTADGKVSPALQAKFVAARELIEVPDRLWEPSSGTELSLTTDIDGRDVTWAQGQEANAAHAGRTVKTLRINPLCALDTMETDVTYGTVKQISGFEQGLPNEANVSIDWIGACHNSGVWTIPEVPNFGGHSEGVITTVCRIGFQAHARAYCPVGVAP